MAEERPEVLQVLVKTLDSQTRSFEVEPEISVREFKQRIAGAVSIAAEKQRLIYQGRVLQDERKLRDYNVGGKVIHLVERAPPQAQPPGSGGPSGGAMGMGGGGGPGRLLLLLLPPPRTGRGSRGGGGGPDRNGNSSSSYVMVGTFNLPIDGSSVDVHINMDQGPAQSEPRMRLLVAQHLLRDIQGVLAQLEGNGGGSRSPPGQAQGPPPGAPRTPRDPRGADGGGGAPRDPRDPRERPRDPREPPRDPRPPEPGGAGGGAGAVLVFLGGPRADLGPPSPAELGEVLGELRRLELRLEPFRQRYRDILGSAATADYSHDAEAREDAQRVLTLVGEGQRLLGNALVALAELRCNLGGVPPRPLQLARPLPHYGPPMLVQQATIPIQINVGTTVTMAGNGGGAGAGGGPAPPAPPPPDRRAPPGPSPTASPGDPPPRDPPGGRGHGGPGPAPSAPAPRPRPPRVIRISHQSVEPVVMMHMNIQDSGSPPSGGSAGPPGPGLGIGGVGVQLPPLPPEFLQAVAHQITQQAMAAAASAATGQPVGGFQAPARVVIARPSAPPPRPTHPGAPQAGGGAAPGGASLAQVISGLVGQLLMQPLVLAQGGSSAPPAPNSAPSSAQATPPTPPGPAPPPGGAPGGPDGSAPRPAPNGHARRGGRGRGSATPPGGGCWGGCWGRGRRRWWAWPCPGTAPCWRAWPSCCRPPSPAPPPPHLHPRKPLPPPPPTPPPPPPPTAPSPSRNRERPRPPPSPAGPAPSLGGSPAPSSSPGRKPRPPRRKPRPPPARGSRCPPEFFTSVLQGGAELHCWDPLGAPPSGPPREHRGLPEPPQRHPRAPWKGHRALTWVLGGSGPPESIAAFLSRLSGTPGLLEGSPGPDGFFGALLALICQHLSMVDVVLLLHGRCQPMARLQPLLRRCFRQRYLGGRDPTDANVRVRDPPKHPAGVRVADGVDITRTNVEFLREQFNRIALHVLRCQDGSFGPRLLELCNRGLFECLALNLHCLRGERGALGALISDRIRRLSADVPPSLAAARLSADVPPSLVGWLTAVVGLRLQAVLEQMPVTPEQVLPYVRHLGEPPEPAPPPTEIPKPVSPAPLAPPTGTARGSQWRCRRRSHPRTTPRGRGRGLPPPATTAEEALPPPESDSEAWAAAVPPEWVPIIREDAQRQRKAKPQPPLSDAYLSGMPAKRRKTMQAEPPALSLAEAVGRAARAAGARTLGSPESLGRDLGELQEGYRQQLQADLQRRLVADPDFSPGRFPTPTAPSGSPSPPATPPHPPPPPPQ
ncbi:LOW QUALITY PROTEIN: large proline-rich protein BAG6 [Passerculus sandwichensis]